MLRAKKDWGDGDGGMWNTNSFWAGCLPLMEDHLFILFLQLVP